MQTNRTIVLASGGLDSSLVMAKLLRQGELVVPLFSNYNQYAYRGEAKAVREVASRLRFKYPYPAELKEVVEVHIDTGIGTIAASPGRVLAFVGAACIWAFTQGWTSGKIAIGIHGGDKDQDSCRIGYEDSLNECVKVLTQGCMEVVTPLMGMSREEMAWEIAGFGIPWRVMYNCYWGPNPCGWQSVNMDYLCPGCRRKQEAMRTVGCPESEWRFPNCHPDWDRQVARRDWRREE